MSKKGKLFREIKQWMVDAKPIAERLLAFAPRVKPLPDDDLLWLFKKIVASEEFKALPDEVTKEIDIESLTNVTPNNPDEDDLPF